MFLPFGCFDLPAEDEFRVVETGDRRVGQEHAMHLAAVPGFKVRQDHGARADLKLGVFLVNIDQINREFKGNLQIPVPFAVGDPAVHKIPV